MQLWNFRELCKPKPLAIRLFLAMCLNGAIAPIVYAATGDEVTRRAAYALGFLGLVVLGLSIYLWVAILQPERF
ncbi:K(+)-transporting ATPase subunit F [Desertifilum sp. FACHB-1129]|uniref:Potassium-transporting ATPase subunit F n=2 Tax=Desertifilum tharense IPPAS B-1220 TaxID=1781255 RepID=A0A1E5QNN1_9CYAN|nr:MULTISPECIES: K(+)-transporting ATPase subunit F [Desertifilum]MBD2312818.1 K(+)-transporting ATPase subunit F [Desertifilum sp. FACHB-1129]MBD2324182.1 K(+)-transporting ATPase subunit F [Desertifilum sp. FACHB-866]MBD2334196.1 K(+)-transporting ATPase subunit F [Desertifilum sp. FACHB-868]OEJ76260.1 potassium-transporting ATPase subunit F [Desertifilum tharense IPPAS B-1220]